MDRLLSVRIDVPRDRGDVFPGDVFERRGIDDLNISWTSLLLTERFAKGSRGDRPLNRTEKRGDSTARERKRRQFQKR